MQTRKDQRSNTFISKKMSYCLRHNPGKYGLKLDEYGYVDLQEFLNAMNHMHHFRPKLTEMKIREIMQASDKERFEIKMIKSALSMVTQFQELLNVRKPLLLRSCTMELRIVFCQVLKKRAFFHWGANMFTFQLILKWLNLWVGARMHTPQFCRSMLKKHMMMASISMLEMMKCGYVIIFPANILRKYNKRGRNWPLYLISNNSGRRANSTYGVPFLTAIPSLSRKVWN